MDSRFGLITGTDQSELREVPGNGGFLALPEAGNAFREMQLAAEKDGIDLQIASSYRDFQR
nr:D-alanyl-D-alanine carboxypeptidase family protein [Succinivibrionaceae bacterium]